MKIKDKYKTLNNKSFLMRMIVNSVYASMALEGQLVTKRKLKNIYNEINKT